jgi:HJR/Mrr/RecB family endonuclease
MAGSSNCYRPYIIIKSSNVNHPSRHILNDESGNDGQAVIITPAMQEAGALRLGEIGEASVAYLEEEAFRAMIEVGLRERVYLLAERRA